TFPKGTFKTITVDNGSEFSAAFQLPIPVYYCHPYCSSERGSNENCNRLVRRFFPKGQSMARRTQRDADAAARAINSMHRKILGYRTAQECFEEQLALLS
ncbi:MAG: IS30 family transposase, partial [Clostridia bacterium]|nr:IS30 family transposase [Clostridia bacterium]